MMKIVLTNSEVIDILADYYKQQNIIVKNMKYTHVERITGTEITGVSLEVKARCKGDE